jgi:hypothetical protein
MQGHTVDHHQYEAEQHDVAVHARHIAGDQSRGDKLGERNQPAKQAVNERNGHKPAITLMHEGTPITSVAQAYLVWLVAALI